VFFLEIFNLFTECFNLMQGSTVFSNQAAPTWSCIPRRRRLGGWQLPECHTFVDEKWSCTEFIVRIPRNGGLGGQQLSVCHTFVDEKSHLNVLHSNKHTETCD